ncbi:hypothetical protein H5410_003355 [Solanum commersonii]|uniref:Uncharacterized protein n=1 Tax=Solanum commersonii TaxID=4109 RepID=A0A9J6B4G2_SOLCO|nr:hypothetical protein H5410_003355 [Solanum commersonii]
MTSPIGLPIFSNQHLLQLTQDQKGLFKACNEAECKVVKKCAAKDHSTQLVHRRSALWSASSPFNFFLQHLRILDHWAI